MTKFKKIFVLVFGLFIAGNAYSQPDPMFSMYFQNMQIFNPAYAGTWEHMGFTAVSRLQWIGVKGHPETQTFSFQTPLKSESVGLGFNLINDKIGLEKHLSVNFDYSYRIDLTDQTSLRLGIKGGFTNYSNPLPFYSTYDPGDPNYLTEIHNKLMPDLGVGAFLSNERSYLGISVPKIIGSKVLTLENYTITEYPQFYASGAVVWTIANNIKFKPAFITKLAEGTPFQFDLSANFLFNDKFWLGSMYRSGDAIGVTAQWIFNRQLRIGYAYDFTTTELQSYQNGVHEVMVSYELNYTKRRYVSPRFF